MVRATCWYRARATTASPSTSVHVTTPTSAASTSRLGHSTRSPIPTESTLRTQPWAAAFRTAWSSCKTIATTPAASPPSSSCHGRRSRLLSSRRSPSTLLYPFAADSASRRRLSARSAALEHLGPTQQLRRKLHVLGVGMAKVCDDPGPAILHD